MLFPVATMASKDDEVICQTFMVKRSQNKKLFTPVNYRERWLVLTRKALIYYDSDGEVSKSPNIRLYIFSNVMNKVIGTVLILFLDYFFKNSYLMLGEYLNNGLNVKKIL